MCKVSMKESMTVAMKLNQGMSEATCETSGTQFCKSVCPIKANLIVNDYYQGMHSSELIENVSEDYYKGIEHMLHDAVTYLQDADYKSLVGQLQSLVNTESKRMEGWKDA